MSDADKPVLDYLREQFGRLHTKMDRIIDMNLPPILPLIMCAEPGCRRPAMAGSLYCNPEPTPRRGFIAGHPGGHDLSPAPVETFESDEDAGITTARAPRIRRVGDL